MNTAAGDDARSIPVHYLFTLYKRFSGYVLADIYRMSLNLVVISCITILGAFIIWMVGSGFDSLNEGDTAVVPVYLAVFIFSVILLQVLRYVNFYLYEWMQQRIINSIRREMYSHLLLLATPFQTKYPLGDLLSRLGMDITRVSEFLVFTPAHLLAYGLTCCLYLGILFYIDTLLAILILFFSPILLLQQKYFARKTRKTAQSFLQNQGRMAAFEEESLRNIQGIITFSAEPAFLNRFDAMFSVFRLAAMRNLLMNNLFVVSFELLIALGAILLVVVGVVRVEQGVLTIGGLISFLLYLGYMSVPLRGLANLPIESQIRAVAAERVSEILDEIPIIQDVQKPIELKKISGTISFDNVSFSYPDHHPTLKNINFEIGAGEFVAIMGPSGIGKTTLIKLLVRLYDPGNGVVRINGQNIRQLSLESLRSHLSIVWQDPFLIDDTVFANLRLSLPSATEEQMREALIQANAHDFILKLPDGYQSCLGSHGVKLSSGQKQRIAIAQALLKKPSILIFDESTSALDSESEKAIHKTLDDIRHQCTIIVIAHRMSTVMSVDRIIYLNKDGTIESGTRDDLMNTNETFRKSLEFQTEIKNKVNIDSVTLE